MSNPQRVVIHPRTSRPKPPQAGNEEASTTLNLGEFQDVETLTLSEAALVINALVAKRRNDQKNVNETEYVKISQYLRHVNVEQAHNARLKASLDNN